MKYNLFNKDAGQNEFILQFFELVLKYCKSAKWVYRPEDYKLTHISLSFSRIKMGSTGLFL